MEAYRRALARATEPGTRTEWVDERYDVPPAQSVNQSGCEQWLRDVGFPEDDETWNKIKTKWISYLSATSVIPDITLAPRCKTAVFSSPDGSSLEGPEEAGNRFTTDRIWRKTVQHAFWGASGFEGHESFTEMFPAKVRTALNAADDGRRGQEFQSLAAIWDLSKRRRYQAVWTSMVGFLVYCFDDGALDDLGLRLIEDQKNDILDLIQKVKVADVGAVSRKTPGASDSVWATIETLLLKAIMGPESTARNNPLVWWMAILVKSAISEDGPDYISRGTFNMNPMPMDLDLRERAAAMIHYGKVLTLHMTFVSPFFIQTRDRAPLAELQKDLRSVDMAWLDKEGGQRPAAGEDKRDCSSKAWLALLEDLDKGVRAVFGEERKASLSRILALEKHCREA